MAGRAASSPSSAGMSREDKLDILAEGAQYDVCLASCSSNSAGRTGRMRDPMSPASRWIYPAYVPGRGRVGILKVLQTNICTNNCSYCAFASSRDNVRRISFAPDELASIFMGFYNQRLCHGIFLSSGMGVDVVASMSRMVETARILRTKYRFGDYIHLKILPDCPAHLVQEAAGVANRISVNLESPAPQFLHDIAPQKNFHDGLLKQLKLAGDVVRSGAKASSHTTQFVVGASGETDLDILRTVSWVYSDYHVFRSYFAAYQSPEPLEESSIVAGRQPLLREHRLYQTDYLLRGYGYRIPDLVFSKDLRLPMNVDPKTAHAMMHPELFPVDINYADEAELLRVPGIGPVSVKRILYTRRREPYHSVEDLKATGAWIRRARPYVVFSGKHETGHQRWLFESEPPSEWVSGDELLRQGEADRPAYPGLKGKPLHYVMGKSTDSIRCKDTPILDEKPAK